MEPNAKLLLDFKRKNNGDTYISRQYFKLPLQIFPPFYPENDGTAFVYLLNPSSGMLEGDLFEMQFHLQNNAQVVLTTPSSNKIYRSNGCNTCQNIYVNVSSGSCMEYIPEHNVPYKNSRFVQKSVFNIEKGGILFSWDTVMPGRLARGECFDFSLYRSDASIYYNGKMILRECFRIVPDELSPDNPAVMADFRIFSTAYLVCENISEGLLTAVREFINSCEGIRGGASSPDNNLMVIKLLIKSTLHLDNTMKHLWDIIRKYTLGKPAFRIRKY